MVLGVSGGADSICMLYVMKELQQRLNLTITVAHVNHHIRGAEADGDMKYVVKVGKKLSVSVLVCHVDVPAEAKERGMSEEEAGRVCRYECFNKVMTQVHATKIAVAHNLNDNSETILFNLFRGTGLRGLSGIPAIRDSIVRPLLNCSRSDIEQYLEENNIKFRMDETNLTTEYSRNKIRLELIPYIQSNINKRAEYNIVNAGSTLNEIEDYLEIQTDAAYKEYVFQSIIKKEAFILHPAILKRLIRRVIKEQAGKLKDITKIHVDSVMALKDMEASKEVDLPYELVAKRIYEGIRINKPENIKVIPFKSIKIIENNEIINRDSILKASLESREFQKENIAELMYTKWLDYDKIKTLILRNRQSGDYITVDDKGSKKKLKDYFINEKIPREERDNILLLADGSHIVWVVGYRIGAYYKVKKNTKNILRLEYKPK